VTTLAPLRNMTVLLAEDDPVMRGSLTRTLGLLFREVLAAGDGHQALEIFAAHRPNMVVLDISMPGPSGLQVAESIRKEDPDLPVIILTCHVDPSFMQQAVRLRLMDYLVKPVGGAALRVNLPGGSVLNLATGAVHREGVTHHLTANERRFLEILVKNWGVMLETVSICLAMEQNGEFTSQALRNLVWRLRSKIGPEAVVSSRDMGYMLS